MKGWVGQGPSGEMYAGISSDGWDQVSWDPAEVEVFASEAAAKMAVMGSDFQVVPAAVAFEAAEKAVAA